MSEVSEHDEIRLLHYDVAGGVDIGLLDRDFASPGYKALFPAWRQAQAAGLASDPGSLASYVAEHLGSNAQLVTLAKALAGYEPEALTTGAAESCLRSLRLRRTKEAAYQAADRFKASLSDPFSVLEHEASRLNEELQALVPPVKSSMVDDVAAIVNEEAKAIAENLKLFYPTGLREIDTRWGGLSNEGPTLLIGISGHGKTSTLNRLGFGLCCNGFGVYTHATEASKEQRIRDIVYSVAGLNQIEARSDPDKKAVVDRLNRAGQMVADLTWDVSGSGMGLQDICARIRAGAMAGKVDVAFIDYLQDIPAQGSEGRMSRTEWVGHCSQTFKDLCAEVQIPIVMGAQATKPLLVDAKINPRPGMYSTQWSSKPAQDAEEVYTLYYNDAMKAEYGEAWTIPGLPGVIEITKRKARRTKLSTVEVDFNGNVRWLGEPAMP